MTFYEKRFAYIATASITRDQTDFATTDVPVVELERLFGVNTRAIYKTARETALVRPGRTVPVGRRRGLDRFSRGSGSLPATAT